MIVLDASVVIAHLSSRDVHHGAAVRFFRSHLDDDFLMHSLTLTEVLVGPTRADVAALAEHHIERLGIVEWMPPPGAARLARLRVESSLKLPDCCVLDAAMSNGAALATFDERLAGAASAFGVTAVKLG